MKYRWNDDVFDSIEDVLDAVIADDYHEDDDYFEEWVNDNYSGVQIYGYSFSAFEIVENCSDSCMSDLLSEFRDEMNERDRDDAEHELERSEVGDVVYCQGETIEVIADEDEEEDVEPEETQRRVCASLDDVRQFIDEQKSLAEQAAEESKREEEEILKLFQVIS